MDVIEGKNIHVLTYQTYWAPLCPTCKLDISTLPFQSQFASQLSSSVHILWSSLRNRFVADAKAEVDAKAEAQAKAEAEIKAEAEAYV